MKRLSSLVLLILTAAVAAPFVVEADVKTREKTTFALEGVLGGMVRVFGGRAAREGVEATTTSATMRDSLPLSARLLPASASFSRRRCTRTR